MFISRKESASQEAYSVMKMEALISSETSTRIYKAAYRDVPQVCVIYTAFYSGFKVLD
jgi:hypothetical protein